MSKGALLRLSGTWHLTSSAEMKQSLEDWRGGGASVPRIRISKSQIVELRFFGARDFDATAEIQRLEGAANGHPLQ